VRRTGSDAEPVIVRAFEFFEAPSFPTATGPFTVWIQLRDGNGSTAMSLVVDHMPAHDLEPDEIVTVRFNLNFRSPNVVLEHQAIFDAGLPLNHEGRYRVRLSADGVTVMQRYFQALRRQP
jgi:hypothetical protein